MDTERENFMHRINKTSGVKNVDLCTCDLFYRSTRRHSKTCKDLKDQRGKRYLCICVSELKVTCLDYFVQYLQVVIPIHKKCLSKL